MSTAHYERYAASTTQVPLFTLSAWGELLYLEATISYNAKGGTVHTDAA